MKIRKFENVKQQKQIGKFKSKPLRIYFGFSFFILFFNAMEEYLYVAFIKSNPAWILVSIFKNHNNIFQNVTEKRIETKRTYVKQ